MISQSNNVNNTSIQKWCFHNQNLKQKLKQHSNKSTLLFSHSIVSKVYFCFSRSEIQNCFCAYECAFGMFIWHKIESNKLCKKSHKIQFSHQILILISILILFVYRLRIRTYSPFASETYIWGWTNLMCTKVVVINIFPSKFKSISIFCRPKNGMFKLNSYLL